ncbi:MAG: nucleotide exchange factor GrpE [Candidatus Scalinduaceae bacterium]
MSKVQNKQEKKDATGKLNSVNPDNEKQEKFRDSHEDSKSELEANTEGNIASEEEKSESKVESEEKQETKEEESDVEEQVVLTKREVDELRRKAEECDSFVDKLLRTRAEFLNYQKRVRKEHEAIAQFAIQDLIGDLFPEFDNFERAVKLAENSKDIDKFVEGIKLIEDQLLKVLEKHGVKRIETVGEPFDPNLHEAVIEEENNELPHHTITEELQRGFLLKDRVIRPSKVKVSKRIVNEEETKKVNDDEDSVS